MATGPNNWSAVMFPPSALAPHRTAVHYGADVGVVVVRHLLVVGAQEADGLVVAVRLRVVPGHRLVAVVGDVLPGRSAQQPQEGHLDHTDRVALRVHVGKLVDDTQRGKKTKKRSRQGNTPGPDASPCRDSEDVSSNRLLQQVNARFPLFY